jgi:predicted dehydrogenase
VADTLAADLVFTAHGHCETAWDTVSTLCGGSGDDMTHYELEKREPLMRELAAFRDAILGRGGTVVTLEEALATVFVAEAVLRSAAAGTVMDLSLEGSTS